MPRGLGGPEFILLRFAFFSSGFHLPFIRLSSRIHRLLISRNPFRPLHEPEPALAPDYPVAEFVYQSVVLATQQNEVVEPGQPFAATPA
jgi:hypothetical protein